MDNRAEAKNATRKTMKELIKSIVFVYEISKKKVLPHSTLGDFNGHDFSAYELGQELEAQFGIKFDDFAVLYDKIAEAGREMSVYDIYKLILSKRTK